jgi:hypothetical protein
MPVTRGHQLQRQKQAVFIDGLDELAVAERLSQVAGWRIFVVFRSDSLVRE